MSSSRQRDNRKTGRFAGFAAVGCGERRYERYTAGAAQSDTARFVAVAVRRVVAGCHVGACVADHEIGAVEKIAVFIDAEADVSAGQAIVWDVVVCAGIREAAAEGAEPGSLAAVLKEEADSVRAIAARAARVAVIGDGLEGDLDARSGGKGARRENGASFVEAVLVGAADQHRAVGEAQRAAADRIRDLSGDARRPWSIRDSRCCRRPDRDLPDSPGYSSSRAAWCTRDTGPGVAVDVDVPAVRQAPPKKYQLLVVLAPVKSSLKVVV